MRKISMVVLILCCVLGMTQPAGAFQHKYVMLIGNHYQVVSENSSYVTQMADKMDRYMNKDHEVVPIDFSELENNYGIHVTTAAFQATHQDGMWYGGDCLFVVTSEGIADHNTIRYIWPALFAPLSKRYPYKLASGGSHVGIFFYSRKDQVIYYYSDGVMNTDDSFSMMAVECYTPEDLQSELQRTVERP